MKYGELNLGQVEAVVNKLGGMDGVRRLLANELVVTEQKSLTEPASESTNLLTPLDEVTSVPASIKPWVARDHFKVDTSSGAELPISYLNPTFQDRFLGKVEEPMLETKLRPRRLNQSELNRSIIKALGGDDKAETQLREMLHYLKSANRTKWFIFYIEDVAGILWAVNVNWNDDGWNLNARSVEDPSRWNVGYC